MGRVSGNILAGYMGQNVSHLVHALQVGNAAPHISSKPVELSASSILCVNHMYRYRVVSLSSTTLMDFPLRALTVRSPALTNKTHSGLTNPRST